MSMGLNIIKFPESNWILKLKKNSYVWLTKEQELSLVDAPFKPGLDHIGAIKLNRINCVGADKHQIWQVTANGMGLDGYPILSPIEGEAPRGRPPYKKYSYSESDFDRSCFSAIIVNYTA